MEERVLIYCRTPPPDMGALERQRKMLLAYAKKHGYAVAGLIQEQANGFSMERPGLKDLSEAIREGKTDLVLVVGMDRLARKTVDAVGYLGWLEQNKVGIICADGFVPDSHLSKAMQSFTDAFESSGHHRQELR